MRPKLEVSVPRRGFIVFLHAGGKYAERIQSWFQSPEGDSLFFYQLLSSTTTRSWARRSFQSPEGDSLFFYCTLCIHWRAGTTRFSPPKGIHCFSTSRKQVRRLPLSIVRFSPPKGIHCFSTKHHPKPHHRKPRQRFSPPKGIHCFSTKTFGAGDDSKYVEIVSVPRRGFIVFLRSTRCCEK